MTSIAVDQSSDPGLEAMQRDARKWIRRRRALYTMLGIYGVLSLMWFAIDLADDSSGFWFYWPMLGVGSAVAIASVALLGVGGLFGAEWEQRQVDHYVRRHQASTGR